MPRLRFRDKRSPSRLKARFALLWRAANGPAIEKEFVFHPCRRWRADFAHIPSRTLIEVEGGIWIQGPHNRAEGFLADIENCFEAAMAELSCVSRNASSRSKPWSESRGLMWPKLGWLPEYIW